MYIVQRKGNNSNTIKVESNLPDKDLMYKYPKNDLDSVFSHYNPETGKNEHTENKLEGRD